MILKKTLLAVSAMALIGILAFARPGAAADKVVFGDQPALTAIVTSVGLEKGYFEEQGIDLSIVQGQRSTAAIQAALAGQLHFAYSANAPFLAATANGAPLVAVGLHSHGYSGILVASKENAGIKQLSDLKGKRLGMQRGTGVETVFLIALEELGLKENDFEITNLRVSDMPTAMQGGSFDAVLGWEPNMSRIVELGYGEKVILPDQFEQMAGITYPFVLFTTQDIVENQPDLVRRFLMAWAKSQEFVDTYPEEAVQILRETLGDAVTSLSDEELNRLTFIYKYDRTALTEADIKDLKRTQEFLFSREKIGSKPDIEGIIDNSFALKAEQELR